MFHFTCLSDWKDCNESCQMCSWCQVLHVVRSSQQGGVSGASRGEFSWGVELWRKILQILFIRPDLWPRKEIQKLCRWLPWRRFFGCCWTRKSNILRVVGHGSENKNDIVHNSNFKRSPFFSCYFTAVLSLQLLTILKGRWHYPIYTDELTQGHLVTFPRHLLCGGFGTRALVFWSLILHISQDIKDIS